MDVLSEMLALGRMAQHLSANALLKAPNGYFKLSLALTMIIQLHSLQIVVVL